METVPELVRKVEENYTSGNTSISKYVEHDMFETLNRIDAAINSSFISGKFDSLGREKPYFNISTAARNIWFRATDIDRKNIRLKAAKVKHYVLSFIAQILLQDWMRKSAFGATLNEWGRTLATYGSAVIKFIEKDGELHSSVIPWNRILCDAIKFDGNVVIEVLEFTPAQLKKQGYDEEVVDSLLGSLSSREDLHNQKKDNKAEYIKVYEVHGELPLSMLTDKDTDEDTYAQQMHVVSFIGKKAGGRGNYKTEYEDFTLYKGKEKKSPYQKDDLIAEDGRTLAIGAVEHLFEAQWMSNHTAKQIKDTLDFASLLILQTSDGTLVGRNVLNSLTTGDILIHAKDEPLTQINNSHDIIQIQNYSAQWQNIAKEIVNTPDAMAGITPPSGTAYRLQALVTNQAQSLFELMTENKGLAIEKMLREHIIPFLKTKMDTTDEVSAILDAQDIAKLDSIYVPHEANRRNNERIKKAVLSGQIADNGDMEALQAEVKGEMNSWGGQRFIKPSDIPTKTWKELLKDFEWEPIVDITGEEVDTQAVLTTLTTVLQTIAGNPAVLQDPAMRVIFTKILEQTGTMSAIELPESKPAPIPQPNGGVSSTGTKQVMPAMAKG